MRKRATSQLSLIFLRQIIAALGAYVSILLVIETDMQICVMRSSNGQARAVIAVIKLFTSSSLQNVNLRNTSLLFSE